VAAKPYPAGDSGPQERRKKSLDFASAALAAGGGTNDPYLSCIIKAQYIRDATGMIIPPWEVDDFPIDWMDAIHVLQVDVPGKRARIHGMKSKR
jgi:hypothetical protein